MLHIHSRSKRPEGEYREAVHKPTRILYRVMDEPFAVETPTGTATGRPGDVFAYDPSIPAPHTPMWVLMPDELERGYDTSL